MKSPCPIILFALLAGGCGGDPPAKPVPISQPSTNAPSTSDPVRTAPKAIATH